RPVGGRVERRPYFVTQTLVTGGSGFIGQHLVAALLAQGCRVRVLDLRAPSYAGVGAQYVKGSILDAKLVHEALDDVVEVYHLAGCRVCGRDARRTFMPSIIVARKLCWRLRANVAFRDFCTARPNPFFSAHHRCNRSLLTTSARRPTKCPEFT